MSETRSADYQDGFNTANERADERIKEVEAENDRLRMELAGAHGANKALKEWINGHRIRGRSAPREEMHRAACEAAEGQLDQLVERDGHPPSAYSLFRMGVRAGIDAALEEQPTGSTGATSPERH